MQTRYRLYTERFDNLAELTSRSFQGFTIFSAVGYWEGIAEQSAVIEIIAEHAEDKIAVLAELIRETNKQTAVMVTAEEVSVRFTLAA